MKNIVSIFVFALIFLMISCTKENTENQQQEPETPALSFAKPANDTTPVFAIDSSATQGVPAKELKDCLLGSFKGATKIPSGAGRMLKNGVTVTKTTGEYIYPLGTISITIADYAGAINEVKARYDMPGEETGMELQKLILPNGYGYSRYSPNEDMTNIYCLLEGRIAVEIIANGTETWFKDHNQLMGLIPSECLGKKVRSQKK